MFLQGLIRLVIPTALVSFCPETSGVIGFRKRSCSKAITEATFPMYQLKQTYSFPFTKVITRKVEGGSRCSRVLDESIRYSFAYPDTTVVDLEVARRERCGFGCCLNNGAAWRLRTAER